MRERYRVFYYFLLGSFGGLTGWFLNAVIFRGIDSQALDVLMPRGAILGSFIGLAIAGYEGFASHSFMRFLRFGAVGFFLGLLAGITALPLAQKTYEALLNEGTNTANPRSSGMTMLIGVLCWALFGGVIGLVEGFGKGTQRYKGFIGGILGGAVGGAFYESARLSGFTENSFTSQGIIATSLALLGGFVGVAIALVATLLSKATIEILDGKIAGREYDVTAYVERKTRRPRGIIGSDKTRANVFVPGDKAVLSQHAYVSYVNEAPTIIASEEAKKTKAVLLLNGRAITTFPLANGDKIKIGNTMLQYHQSKKSKSM